VTTTTTINWGLLVETGNPSQLITALPFQPCAQFITCRSCGRIYSTAPPLNILNIHLKYHRTGADQYDLLARVIQHRGERLTLKSQRHSGEAADRRHDVQFGDRTCFMTSPIVFINVLFTF